MLLAISAPKNLEISQENIGGGALQTLKKVSFLEIYNKFLSLINTTKYDNMLISYLK